MDLNQLKEAGFNDQELKNYVDTESKQLINAGFSDQEVNDYFGIKKENRTEIKSYWQTIKDSVVQPVVSLGERKQKAEAGVNEVLVGKEFDPKTYWERGVGKQIFSLIDAYNTTGELPKAFTTPEPKDTGLVEGLIERSATL